MIDLTPLEVRKKKGDFRRGLRGYDAPQVDDFLDIVADRLETVVRENASFHDRIARLEQQVTDYREREKALTEALVTAQEMREEMRSQSAREADLARRHAEQDAARIRAEAAQVRDREEDTLRRLRARQLQFLNTYRAFLERELSELESIVRSLELNGAMAEGEPPRPALGSTVAEPRASGEQAPASRPAAPTSTLPSGAEPAARAPQRPPVSTEPSRRPPEPMRTPPAAQPPRTPPAAQPPRTPPSGEARRPPTTPERPRPDASAEPPRQERTAFAAGIAGASLRPVQPEQPPAAPPSIERPSLSEWSGGAASPTPKAPETDSWAAGGPAGERSPPADEWGPPPGETKRPAQPDTWATDASPEGEAELILSDDDVLADPDLDADMDLLFGNVASPPKASSPDKAAGPPASPPASGGSIGLDLVPELEDFTEFGNLEPASGTESSKTREEKRPPGATSQPGGKNVDPDDPEDLLSSLFRDDR